MGHNCNVMIFKDECNYEEGYLKLMKILLYFLLYFILLNYIYSKFVGVRSSSAHLKVFEISRHFESNLILFKILAMCYWHAVHNFFVPLNRLIFCDFGKRIRKTIICILDGTSMECHRGRRLKFRSLLWNS